MTKQFYLATEPVIAAFGNNGTRIKLEREGKFPKRVFLQSGSRKPAYVASEVDALIAERMQRSQEDASRNALIGERLLAARQARAQERAAKVLVDAELRAAKILEGRKPRVKKEASHNDPA